jgi:hypothetical protein
MVSDDAGMQVWLETQVEAGKVLVVPYVKAANETHGTYSMLVTKSGPAGNSRISQQGRVDAAAAQPVALSRLTLDVRKEDECRIELTLRQGDDVIGTYVFDCPR